MTSFDREAGSTFVCVGCGYCCIKSPCVKSVLNDYGYCIYLFWGVTSNRYLCSKGILDHLFFKEASMGEGCCSNLNDWRKNVIQRF